MRALDILFFTVLILGLSTAVYVLWMNAPQPIKTYQEYVSNYSPVIISNESQFFPNMRYENRKISYQIASSCSQEKVSNIENAFNIISEKTILRFYKLESNAQINISCPNKNIEPDSKGYFVAGEGGKPTYVKTNYYTVMFSSEMEIYTSEVCKTPQIAIHEILHTLGFSHTANPDSVLYPISSCNKEIDQSIVDEINKLYKADSLIDLEIEKVNATRQGAYFNISISISNQGLKDSAGSTLTIGTEKGAVKDFNLGSMPIGSRRDNSITNLRIDSKAKILTFHLESPESELTLINNEARISLNE
jgi:hypothetical protein